MLYVYWWDMTIWYGKTSCRLSCEMQCRREHTSDAHGLHIDRCILYVFMKYGKNNDGAYSTPRKPAWLPSWPCFHRCTKVTMVWVSSRLGCYWSTYDLTLMLTWQGFDCHQSPSKNNKSKLCDAVSIYCRSLIRDVDVHLLSVHHDYAFAIA